MKILWILMILVFSGCSAEPQNLAVPRDMSNIEAVATLADAKNKTEMAVAPIMTKITLVRISAIMALRNGRINVDTAKAAQRCADAAMDELNAAKAVGDTAAIRVSGENADSCQHTLDHLRG